MYKLTSISQPRTEYPGVAQLVAHLTGGQGVVSSSLATRTSKKLETERFRAFLFFRKSDERAENQKNAHLQQVCAKSIPPPKENIASRPAYNKIPPKGTGETQSALEEL